MPPRTRVLHETCVECERHWTHRVVVGWGATCTCPRCGLEQPSSWALRTAYRDLVRLRAMKAIAQRELRRRHRVGEAAS